MFDEINILSFVIDFILMEELLHTMCSKTAQKIFLKGQYFLPLFNRINGVVWAGFSIPPAG